MKVLTNRKSGLTFPNLSCTSSEVHCMISLSIGTVLNLLALQWQIFSERQKAFTCRTFSIIKHVRWIFCKSFRFKVFQRTLSHMVRLIIITLARFFKNVAANNFNQVGGHWKRFVDDAIYSFCWFVIGEAVKRFLVSYCFNIVVQEKTELQVDRAKSGINVPYTFLTIEGAPSMSCNEYWLASLSESILGDRHSYHTVLNTQWS